MTRLNKILLGFVSLVFILLISIQLRPVHYLLLNNSIIDSTVSKFDKYSSLKESIYNRFPGFAYSYIGINIAGSEKDPEKILKKINLYITNNVFQPSHYKPEDAAAIAQLERGIGWCDQMSHILIRLADTHNLPGQIENLVDNSGSSPHTIATVFLEDEWRPLDPTFGISFINDNDRLITKKEVCKNFQKYFEPSPGFNKIYCNDTLVFMKNEAAGEYSPIIFDAIKNQQAISISTVSDPWRLIFKLPDFIGADLFIKLYLMTLESSLNDYEHLYKSARIFHILGKYEKAIKLYEKVVKEYPKATYEGQTLLYAVESSFWIGLARFQNGQYSQALNVFDNFINNTVVKVGSESTDSSFGWSSYAKVYAGKSLLELERPEEAFSLLNDVANDNFSASAQTLALRELFILKNLNNAY